MTRQRTSPAAVRSMRFSARSRGSPSTASPPTWERRTLCGMSFWEEPPNSKPSSGRCSSNVRSSGRRGGRNTGGNSSPKRNCNRSSCRSATRTLLRWPGLPDTGAVPNRRARAARSGPNAAAHPVGLLRTGNRISTSIPDGFSAQYEGIKTADWGQQAEFGSGISAWYRRNGIDVHCQGHVDGVDLQLWLIDDSRWDTLEAEIQKDEPLAAWPGSNQLFGTFRKKRGPTSSTTSWRRFCLQRERADAVSSRSFPKIKDADRYRLRYRMWLTTAGQRPAAGRPAGR